MATELVNCVMCLCDPNQIALTFDDGPSRTYTPELLSILKDYGAKATFFVIGENVEQCPEIVKQIHDAGHSLGNHSYTHPDLSMESAGKIDHELKECQRLLAKVLGNLTPVLFRPPYGRTAVAVMETVRSLGLKMVYWSCDSEDWAGPRSAAQLVTRVRAQIDRGDEGQIVLFHDGHERVVPAWRTDRRETVKAVKILLEQYSGKREFIALT